MELVASELLMATAALVTVVHSPTERDLPLTRWTVLRLTSGTITLGMELTSEDTGVRYAVENFAVGGGTRAWAEGYRTVRLRRLTPIGDGSEQELKVGERLREDA